MPVVALVGIALLAIRPPLTLMRLVARLLPRVVFFYAPAGRRAVALSLDDGPHPSTTPAVLDTLRAHGAKATFFLLDAAARHGYRCVLGSVYPQDARVHWRRYLVWDVLRRVRPGAIVILHEGRPERAVVTDVLDAVLPELGLRGYEITTVSELLDSQANVAPVGARGA